MFYNRKSMKYSKKILKAVTNGNGSDCCEFIIFRSHENHGEHSSVCSFNISRRSYIFQKFGKDLQSLSNNSTDEKGPQNLRPMGIHKYVQMSEHFNQVEPMLPSSSNIPQATMYK